MKGYEMYEKMAEALPWEVQSLLLAVRDEEGLRIDKIPDLLYFMAYELMLIEPEGDFVILTRLGNHLVNHCTC